MKKIFLYIILSILFFIPLFIYIYPFNGNIPINNEGWAEFGSYLSGVYGTFAFLILAYTTNITRKQFKIQNEDNVFFKLFESLQNRVSNYSITSDDIEYTANKTLKILSEQFSKELSKESIEIARILLAETPEKIANVSYMKIFSAIKGQNVVHTFLEEKENFLKDMNSCSDFNERWEKLKFYIDSRGNESDNVKEALRATGSINFYTISYEKRQMHYSAVVQLLHNKYGEFLDGYLNNISYLLKFANNSINKKLYIEFIKSQLTKYELIIIFYLLSGEEKFKDMYLFYELGIMDRISTIECRSLMIDVPSEEQIKLELEYIFK